MKQVNIDIAEAWQSQPLPMHNQPGHDPDTLWELYDRDTFYRHVAAEAIRRRDPNITFADLPAILADYMSANGAPSDSQEAGDRGL